MGNLKPKKQSGFTLIELVLVVMIIAILAGMVLPLLSGFTVAGKSAEEVVTETKMLTIRDAILGTTSSTGAWADLRRDPTCFPIDPYWLTLSYEQLVIERNALVSFLVSNPAKVYAGIKKTQLDNIISMGTFNPVTKIGWRGPYIRLPRVESESGEISRFVLADGWGTPLRIVAPLHPSYTGSGSLSDVTYVRLASGGGDNVMDTLDPELLADLSQLNQNYRPGGPDDVPQNEVLTKSESGDDVVLFFFAGDTLR